MIRKENRKKTETPLAYEIRDGNTFTNGTSRKRTFQLFNDAKGGTNINWTYTFHQFISVVDNERDNLEPLYYFYAAVSKVERRVSKNNDRYVAWVILQHTSEFDLPEDNVKHLCEKQIPLQHSHYLFHEKEDSSYTITNKFFLSQYSPTY